MSCFLLQGVVVVVETSTGLLLGAARGVEKGQSPDTVGSQAVHEVIEAVNSGACVDEW